MKYDIYGVYLVNFKLNTGGELSGKHYAVILSTMHRDYKTFLVAPITSKKPPSLTVLKYKTPFNPRVLAALEGIYISF